MSESESESKSKSELSPSVSAFSTYPNDYWEFGKGLPEQLQQTREWDTWLFPQRHGSFTSGLCLTLCLRGLVFLCFIKSSKKTPALPADKNVTSLSSSSILLSSLETSSKFVCSYRSLSSSLANVSFSNAIFLSWSVCHNGFSEHYNK